MYPLLSALSRYLRRPPFTNRVWVSASCGYASPCLVKATP
jgi:hypothetical protein